ncbi:SCP1.201-like deaminase [Actinokineospora auranticolor]|uniref:Nucleic acid/nucleotide deaminase of polymorphic system toxin n=1 Tax=Actinokineospora auranticolor TaxID=155976 RepID=A0A2S6GM73_9PSEU|nr:DddA-like double-stranded DNA deaminase toxin [Actinokineospora auranticolor]PPK66241.1 nucleic acid/nucleotide deaminase of polymorphic system toxin [Actinokineospora auranticolor]
MTSPGEDSIAEAARRLARLATTVTDLQSRLRDWYQALDSVDRAVAGLLGQSDRADRINQVTGHAEQCLRDLDTTLDKAAQQLRATADHHLGTTGHPPPSGPDPHLSHSAQRQRLRTGLPPDLPRTRDRTRRQRSAKTHGRWIGLDGEIHTETSGWDDKYYAAVTWFQQADKKVPNTTADVEVKLAVHMRTNRIRHIVLAINNVPCVGDLGCDTLIPRILPAGYTMTVHGANGFHKVYHGKAQK